MEDKIKVFMKELYKKTYLLLLLPIISIIGIIYCINKVPDAMMALQDIVLWLLVAAIGIYLFYSFNGYLSKHNNLHK